MAKVKYTQKTDKSTSLKYVKEIKTKKKINAITKKKSLSRRNTLYSEADDNPCSEIKEYTVTSERAVKTSTCNKSRNTCINSKNVSNSLSRSTGKKEDFKETRTVVFTKKQLENWIPLSETVLNGMNKLKKSAVEMVLNKSHGLYDGEINKAVVTSSERLLSNLKAIKVPRQSSFHQQEKMNSDKSMYSYDVQVTELEAAIEEDQKLRETLQDEKEEMMRNNEDDSQSHPLMQETYMPSLQLPVYSVT